MWEHTCSYQLGYLSEDTGIRTLEDYEYWLRIALKYEIGYIDEPLGLYRVHSQGISRSLNNYRIDQKVLERFLDDPGADKEIIRERIQNLYCKSAVYNWGHAERKEAIEDLKKYVNWSIRKGRIANVLKAVILYLVLVTGVYKIFLAHPKRFRKIF